MEMRAPWVVPSRSAPTSTERIFNLSLAARPGCVSTRRASRCFLHFHLTCRGDLPVSALRWLAAPRSGDQRRPPAHRLFFKHSQVSCPLLLLRAHIFHPVSIDLIGGSPPSLFDLRSKYVLYTSASSSLRGRRIASLCNALSASSISSSK